MDELLRSDRSDFLLLRRYTVEEIGEAGQQRFLLLVLLLLFVLEDFLTERLAEEQRLQHGITVARVAELDGGKNDIYLF